MSSRPSPAESDQPGVPARDAGQAAVEFALALPIVVLVALGMVQIILVVADQLAVGVAARDAARAASVSASPAAAATAAATAAVSLDSMDVTTSVGEQVTVTVRTVNTTSVPLIGAFIGDVELAATVTMQREPP